MFTKSCMLKGILFSFTTLAVNGGFVTYRHRDKNNEIPSVGETFGACTGCDGMFAMQSTIAKFQ